MPDWNEKQQEVLDSLVDHRDILVSAAAGSALLRTARTLAINSIMPNGLEI